MRISANGRLLLERMADNPLRVKVWKGEKGYTFSQYNLGCGELYTTLTVRALLRVGAVEVRKLTTPVGNRIGTLVITEKGKQYLKSLGG